MPPDRLQERLFGIDLAVACRTDRVDGICGRVRRIIESMGDFINFVEPEPGLFETVFDRLTWKIATVFFTIETLFSRGRDDDAVHDERRGRVMALRHAVFAVVETRPVFLLKRNGIFQAADANDIHQTYSLDSN